MALTKNDLAQIQEMFLAQDKRFIFALRQESQDIKRDIRDEMDARFIAFERKMDMRFAEVDTKIYALDTRLTTEIQSLVRVILSFFPERFESLESDVARLKRHVGIA